MATAQDIIEGALRKIHVLGKGSSLDNDEAQDALETLNAMLATWSAEGDLVFTESKETFNLTTANSYTIGSSGDFNTTRPLYFTAAYVTSGNIDYSLEFIDNQQYSTIPLKTTGSIPEYLYYDANYPLGTIYLYPSPSSVTTITLYSVKPITSFSSLTTTFSMPEEYKASLIYNLAVWLAPEYEREASPTVQRVARSSKDVVMAQNKRNEFWASVIDVPADRKRPRGNIYEGWYT